MSEFVDDREFEIEDSRPVAFYWVDMEFPDDDRIDGYDIAIYNIICKYANASKGNTAFPSQSLIADKLKFGRSLINQRLKKLEELGYLSSRFRARQDGGNSSKIYRIMNAKSVYYAYIANKEHRNESCVSDVQGGPCVYDTQGACVSSTQGHVCVIHSNNNNTNKNNSFNKNKDIKDDPVNIPKKKTLFDIPSKEPKVLDPLKVLEALKGKSKIVRKVQYVLAGELDTSYLDDLDLCLHYAQMHKEIVGYEIPYQKENYMRQFRQQRDISIHETFQLIPQILEVFKRMCEESKRKKSEWFLKIGLLTFEAPSDISRIMDKVKPKMNEKYIVKDEQTPTKQGNDIVDEVF